MKSEPYQPAQQSDPAFNETDSLLRRRFGNSIHTGPTAEQWHIPVNTEETEDQLLIIAELPGMSIDELHLEVEGDILTIHGFHSAPPGFAERQLQRKKGYGSFRHSIHLKCRVLVDRVRARFDYGILKITLPKAGTELH